MRAANCQVLLAIACLLTAAACSHRADDCRNTLTCGNFDAGSGGSSKDSGAPDASVCGAPCSSTTHCDVTIKRCVECTSSSNCREPTSLCETDAGICIQCKANSDCPDVKNSVCSGGTCTPCAGDGDCAHFTAAGTTICKTPGDAGTESGTCVQCTLARESVCGGHSCDPATNACTTTLVNSANTCEPCAADSECNSTASAVARCVPMDFGTAFRGNYCLQQGAQVATCPGPYRVIKTLNSLSGVVGDSYCGFDDVATTCEAIRDLIALTTCTGDASCGCITGTICKGGKCPTTGAMAGICTIPCSSGANCLAGPPGNTCPTGLASYCQ